MSIRGIRWVFSEVARGELFGEGFLDFEGHTEKVQVDGRSRSGRSARNKPFVAEKYIYDSGP